MPVVRSPRYNGHYRRFLVLEEFSEHLKKVGFTILQCEQGSGFAPYGTEDPVVVRIVARKDG